MVSHRLNEQAANARRIADGLGYRPSAPSGCDNTQEELADKAEIHANHVGGLKRGERNITGATLFRLAKTLRVAPRLLLEGYD